jgi:radical SAM superfamily enzyme YgiQ (UPF0313 family)
MAKILFLNPYAESDFGRQSIPLSLIFTLLKKNGHECELFDTTFLNNDFLREGRPNHDLELKKLKFFKEWDNNFFKNKKEGNVINLFQSKIDEFKPDIITFSFWGSHLHAEGEYFAFENGLKIINSVKINSSAKIIVGGTIPSSKPSEVLYKNQIINYIIKGESELVYLDIANFIDQNKDLNKIDNLCYLKNDKICINSLRPLIDPLDILPDVQMSMFDDRNFYRPFHGKIVRMVDFELSRGCWYRCTFCLSPFQREVVYKKAKNFRREKSIEKIIREISNLKKDLKLDFIRYQDESFNSISEDKLKELSVAYKKYVNLPFIIEATINTSTENKIKYLSQMGCVSVGLGIESGSERLRKDVIQKPPFSNKQVIDVIKCYKKYGISVTTYNIIGFPTETEEDLWETINLNYKAKPNFSTVSYFQPWEGTALKQSTIEKGILDKEYLKDNFSPGQQGDTILNLDKISRKKLKHYHDNFQSYVKYPKFSYKFIKKFKQVLDI